jgi:ankyrin repeat protein
MVRRLLAAGADPKAALLLGETVLMQASRTGNAEVVEMLLTAGADVNARGPIQETAPCPLPGVYEFQSYEPNVHQGLRPAELERISTMRCGLQAGNQTALIWAVSNRHPEVVARLLEHGADVHARTDVWSQMQAVPPSPLFEHQRAFLHGGSTAIILAAQVGDLTSVKLLLEAGADVNDRNAWGHSAIALAAFANFGEVVRFLLEQGANPNPPSDEEVLAPLHSAIMYQDETTVAALLAHGADPNAPLQTWNPRVRSSGSRWINFYPGQVGAPPLWLAARWSTPNIMRLLAAHGADPRAVHTSIYYGGGNSGIDAYLFTEQTTILMAALNQGGPGNAWARPAAGGTGGARRSRAEVLEAVKLAVELGADVNAVNDARRTCEVPWETSYRPGARKPCDPGAPFRVPGDEGSSDRDIAPRTALDAAIALRHDAVVEYLLEHGATRGEGEPSGR